MEAGEYARSGRRSTGFSSNSAFIALIIARSLCVPNISLQSFGSLVAQFPIGISVSSLFPTIWFVSPVWNLYEVFVCSPEQVATLPVFKFSYNVTVLTLIGTVEFFNCFLIFSSFRLSDKRIELTIQFLKVSPEIAADEPTFEFPIFLKLFT